MRHIIFGESHGPAIGVTLEGVPPGLVIDIDFIEGELSRRAPGTSPLATARREADAVRFLSGVYNGRATGTPLTAVIENTDTRSADYAGLNRTPRPSHADYTGALRYGGFCDHRGGGHFSGRLTAPLVVAGAIAKLILTGHGISVAASISCVGGQMAPTDVEYDAIVAAAKADGDSVGGAICCTVTGLPAGCGAPDFGQNVEGLFARQLFAVPAVKAVEFGAGTAFAAMRGSEANDSFLPGKPPYRTATNHAGGINGGITNGMPVAVTVTLRPTPSIAKEQDTVDLTTGEAVTLTVTGRHDPCIVRRALPVIEAACALASLEVMGL